MDIRVAVLEDDRAFREDILVKALSRRGFDVEGFARAADLYQRMLAVSFELLVLDVRLEGEDGLDVARYLRGISPIGIVALTGRATHEERVRGLMEAVDVWLGKPIDLDVLAATLHSLSRRIRSSGHSALRAEPAPEGWRLSPGNWRLVSPDGRSMPLNLLERHLLVRLMATPSDLVAHADLMEALAAVGGAFDRHRLEIVIHRLRRKAEHHFGLALPLVSVRGSGYVLLASEERSRSSSIDPETRRSHGPGSADVASRLPHEGDEGKSRR
jgi:DNA-binding response OmpR family regulator